MDSAEKSYQNVMELKATTEEIATLWSERIQVLRGKLNPNGGKYQ